MDVVKVSATSKTKDVAGALAGAVRSLGSVEAQAIGAKAVNQAVKAIAIARSYVLEEGIELVAVPRFVLLRLDGKQCTAIRITVADRAALSSPPLSDEPMADPGSTG